MSPRTEEPVDKRGFSPKGSSLGGKDLLRVEDCTSKEGSKNPIEGRPLRLTPERMKELQEEVYGRPIAELSDQELKVEKWKTLFCISKDRHPLATIPSWSATELLSHEFSDPQWVVEGLIPTGLTILAGTFKAGKSFLALQLCHAVATGSLFLGELPTQPAPVLYLSLEDGPRRVQTRLRRLGLSAVDTLHFAFETGSWDVKAIAIDAVAQKQVNLVVIDTLVRIIQGSETNSYEDMYAFLHPIKKVADELGIAVVLIHHLRKGSIQSDADPFERILGSVGINGVADAILLLQRSRMSREGVLSFTSRDIEEKEYALSFDEDCRWSIVGDAAEVRLSVERRQILECLQRAKRKELSTGKIAEELGKKTSSVSNLLRRLEEEGYVCQGSKFGFWRLPKEGEQRIPPGIYENGHQVIL